MGELNLFLIIIYVHSLCIQLTICVYDADFVQEEEIERETVPSPPYDTTETLYLNKSSLSTSFGNETRRKRDQMNTTTLLHTAVNINGSNKNLKNNQIKAATTLELSKNSTSQLCSFFIYNSGFDMDKMPGLWRAVYYKMAGKLHCFQLIIRRTSLEEREENKRVYGDFNKTINWDECHIEIKSSAVKNRNHFLQGGAGDLGVMRNMILSPADDGTDGGVFSLREESPDQWLMVKNLLLLHGCEGDEVVAFARTPQHVSKEEIAETLRELGEEMTGEILCHDAGE